jgi:hypothetical protein
MSVLEEFNQKQRATHLKIHCERKVLELCARAEQQSLTVE